MKISYNWLKDFVKIDKTPEKLAEVLTLSGTEAEGVKASGDTLDKVVVGEIITIVKHTNADKLRVCKVRVKKGVVLNIVCGAPNIEVGQKVPTALVGAKLPNGIILEKTKIRGVESEGMLLAEDEMGLGKDHAGIYLLDKKEPIGKSIKAVLGLNDTVLDLALTPNRADCYSVLGVAREVAAVTKRKLNFNPDRFRIKEKTNEIGKKLTVKVSDSKLCPKYTARVIENLQIKDSPEWMKSRLRASGVRPINNVVDVTNYVMLEMGQPLHAFDYEKLSGADKQIVVRPAYKNEKIETLDGKERILDPNMLLITEGKKALAVAGVMGGKDSEISDKTKTVILESAIFNPGNIRKTAQKLNLRSESEMRFEKGLDYQMSELVADRAASLIAKLGNGRVVPGILSVTSKVQAKPATINLSLSLIKKYLNINLAESKVKLILKSLGFEIIAFKEKVLKIQVPSWRDDVRLPEDLIEEIGRLYDYNKLKPTYLKGTLKPVDLPKELVWENKIKDILAAAGLSEVYNYSFYSENLACQFNLDPNHHYRVTNPINPDQALMRQSLIPLLIKNLEFNKEISDNIGLFEIGHTFTAAEQIKLAIVAYGPDSFYRLKGLINLLGRKLNLSSKVFYKLIPQQLGMKLMAYFKFNKPVVYFEVNLYELIKEAKDKSDFIKPKKYPVVIRDISFFKPKEVSYQAVENEIKGLTNLITEVEVFDRFEKEGQISLALRLTFQADRTLRAEEVDEVMNRIYENLGDKYNIKIRK
ncbi:MAG: phenylalanine--tRNA ligase subunit beta [Patescibacteria group bacterium]